MYIDPDLKNYIDSLQASSKASLRPSEPPTLEQRRAGILELVSSLMVPPRPVHAQIERHVPGPKGDIRTLVVAPRASDEPLPVVVWYHGGGTVMMSPEVELPLVTAAAVEADCIMVAPAYGRAPENPFPGPLEDCYAVFEWARAHAAEIGGDPARVAVGGVSGGGYLAAAVCLEAKRLESPQPYYQFLMMPMVDQAGRSRSFVEYEWVTGPGPRAANMADKTFLYHHAFGEHRRDPRASPILADDHTGLAPAAVFTCQLDPLHDEGVAYVARLRQAAVRTMHVDYEGATHVFPFMGKVADHANMIMAQIYASMRYALDPGRYRG